VVADNSFTRSNAFDIGVAVTRVEHVVRERLPSGRHTFPTSQQLSRLSVLRRAPGRRDHYASCNICNLVFGLLAHYSVLERLNRAVDVDALIVQDSEQQSLISVQE
jgi:hypothetical protein